MRLFVTLRMLDESETASSLHESRREADMIAIDLIVDLSNEETINGVYISKGVKITGAAWLGKRNGIRGLLS